MRPLSPVSPEDALQCPFLYVPAATYLLSEWTRYWLQEDPVHLLLRPRRPDLAALRGRISAEGTRGTGSRGRWRGHLRRTVYEYDDPGDLRVVFMLRYAQQTMNGKEQGQF
jgi:hypothetical protein